MIASFAIAHLAKKICTTRAEFSLFVYPMLSTLSYNCPDLTTTWLKYMQLYSSFVHGSLWLLSADLRALDSLPRHIPPDANPDSNPICTSAITRCSSISKAGSEGSIRICTITDIEDRVD